MTNELTMLKNSSLFKDMSDVDIQKFLDAAEIKNCTQEEVLYMELHENEDIFFIVDGEVRAEVTIDKDSSGMDFKRGEFLGLSKFVQYESPVALLTATAKKGTRLLVWKASHWRQICDKDTKTGYLLSLRVGKMIVDHMLNWNMRILDNVSWGIE